MGLTEEPDKRVTPLGEQYFLLVSQFGFARAAYTSPFCCSDESFLRLALEKLHLSFQGLGVSANISISNPDRWVLLQSPAIPSSVGPFARKVGYTTWRRQGCEPSAGTLTNEELSFLVFSVWPILSQGLKRSASGWAK